jgi:cleavage stimulation factor subunit 3
MADEIGQNILSPSAQSAQASSSLAYPAPENTTTDSSATMSVPLNSSGSNSPDVTRESLLSPTPATSAHLPPRPHSALSSSAATPNLTSSAAPAPASAPRLRGGFEVDDDEDNEDVDPGKDEVDVYDPTVGFDVDTPTPAHIQTPLDRTAQSPERENGTTPVPVQSSGSPAGASSSILTAGPGATSVSAEESAHALVESQAKAAPSQSDLNGSVLPLVSKSRLAHDIVGILEDRIEEDPRGDTEAYLELINELKSRNKEAEVRKVYDNYLTKFPLDVS